MALINLVNDIQTMGQNAPAAQIERISKFYVPLLEYNYEDPMPRAAVRKIVIIRGSESSIVIIPNC